MNQYLIHPQSFCDPVLRDAKAVHTKYLDVESLSIQYPIMG